MADEKELTPAEVAANNEKTARELEAQGAQHVTSEADVADTRSALDRLMAGVVEKKPDDPPAGAEPTAEEKAAAEAKAAEEKAAADKIASEREAHLKKSEEFFKDSPGLPPNASPKSAEAFSTVKIRAAQEISAREAKIEELNKQLAEAQEKLKNPVPAEIERELKEHREFRAKLDVDADPKFKEFDKAIANSQEFIYAQLRKSPTVTDKVIEEIKKFGGPENVNMAKLFSTIQDPVMQRLVESKIADIEMVKFNREQAVKTAKDNIGQYVAERQKASTDSVTAHNTATAKHLETFHGQMAWLAEKPVDPKADEAARKSVEDYNKFIAETKQSMAVALKDDSAEMRALMIAGMAQLMLERRVSAADKLENVTLKKENTELKDKLARFKDASVSRLRETAAPSDGKVPKANEATDWNKPTVVALDDIARQVMEERAAKGL